MGVVQDTIRAITSTAETYEGDWHAYCDLRGIAEDQSWSGRVLAWAQSVDSTITTSAAAHNYALLNPTAIV